MNKRPFNIPISLSIKNRVEECFEFEGSYVLYSGTNTILSAATAGAFRESVIIKVTSIKLRDL